MTMIYILHIYIIIYIYSYSHVKLATFSAVSDADGDTVRCRWAESAQGECDGVCQVFPEATLDQVSIANYMRL